MDALQYRIIRLCILVLISFSSILGIAANRTVGEIAEKDSSVETITISDEAAPRRTYLFIHDTSSNMRKRQRIPIMQDSIHDVLSALDPKTLAGLRAFGHRFSLDAPDACQDTDLVIPIVPLHLTHEDFTEQMNMLQDTPLGGAAPLGLALQKGIEDIREFPGQKEIYLYAVDVQKCTSVNPIDVLKSACQVENLHITLIGIALNRDLELLEKHEIDRLGCADILNVTTADEAETLSDQLLTRVSIEFRNAEDERIDPRPGEKLVLRFSQRDSDGMTPVREKVKTFDVRGSSIETVGLPEGTYFMDLQYEGQKLRSQQEIVAHPKTIAREIVHLGRMQVKITDSEGQPLNDPVAQDLNIAIIDAGKTIRTAAHVGEADFDLLPGEQYTVQVSYTVGGEVHTLEFQEQVAIQEGNHKRVSIALPIGAIAGKIVNMKGDPASQVKMTLIGIDKEIPIEQSTLTDQQGSFLFPDLPNGTYTLTLEKEGYSTETRRVNVVGGKITTLEAMQLFRGIEIQVSDVSGQPIDDPEVTCIYYATSQEIPLVQHQEAYRNAEFLEAGTYRVIVRKEGYEASAQEIELSEEVIVQNVPVQLPHFIEIAGYVTNGKAEQLAGVALTFQDEHSTFLPDESIAPHMIVDADGSFSARLLVSEIGEEHIRFSWKDAYNQEYSTYARFQLPTEPHTLDLGEVRLPINFLQLSLSNVLTDAINADRVILHHQQTGQTGIAIRLLQKGQYESVPLLDGDYTLRVLKKGYQDVEYALKMSGGKLVQLPLTLHHYITVVGTVSYRKNNRATNASITFGGQHSELTSLSSVTTGKDGRFQATLLVKEAQNESVQISWTSPETERTYQTRGMFELSGPPITDAFPLDLGEFSLPVNFITVEIQDVSETGLPGVDVKFIAADGDVTAGKELGNGMYESLDLLDGYYNIAISKSGYKEHLLRSDTALGEGLRVVQLGPVVLPHYIKVEGTILNGKEEGVPNVAVQFGNTQSEQLELCRTDQKGYFTSTLLVQGTGEEQWKASWKRLEYQASGSFMLPEGPGEPLNLGEIYIPANFVLVSVQDVLGNMLSGVEFKVTYKDGLPLELAEFNLEETEPGLYMAQNLPDGSYTFFLEKAGYDADTSFDVSIQGGEYLTLPPIQLGYYLTINGTVLNGKQEPVSGAEVHVQELCSTVIAPEKSDLNASQEAKTGETPPASAAAEEKPLLLTDDRGKFSTQILVNSPGVEEVKISWDEQYSSIFPLPLAQTPQSQDFTFNLPINFVNIDLTDVQQQPLSGMTVTLTHQIEKVVFSLQETSPGTYQSQGIPDGDYTVFIGKDGYQTQSHQIQLQAGEVQQLTFRVPHYITVRGHVLNGKEEGVSGATIDFEYLKTSLQDKEKILSGTDGAFEATLLVEDAGKEAGSVFWTGKHGTYLQKFWIDLPMGPADVSVGNEHTLLPINFISLEIKSVAATGVSGATVTVTNQEQNLSIEAQDNGQGNYEVVELPDGVYDIQITKENYKTITIKQVHVANGEHKNDIVVPKFAHYITMSGVILNGKDTGVNGAQVAIPGPTRLEECEPVSTREDGSFTLHALVTDVGTENIDVVWNETYSVTVPVTLPSIPEHVSIREIKLPINFIAVRLHSVFGESISGAQLLFVKQELRNARENPSLNQSMTVSEEQFDMLYASTIDPLTLPYIGQETSKGAYESPELPDGNYIVISKKEGYIQKHYPIISVRSGVMASDTTITLPHLINVTGKVTNGKGEGVNGAQVMFAGQSSQMGITRVLSDDSGMFSARLKVTGTGRETITVTWSDPTSSSGEYFKLTQEFSLPKKPGSLDFEELLLPINFIPIRVQDVGGGVISDAAIHVMPVEATDTSPVEPPQTMPAILNAGDGNYEASCLKDGTYRIVVTKDGYESQERTVSVTTGEIAPETIFVLPHYVLVKGVVSDGKGNGVPDAAVEFDSQLCTLVPLSGDSVQAGDKAENSNSFSTVTTDIDGHFTAQLLVKRTGNQRVRVVWDEQYVRQMFFPLPKQPDSEYILEETIRLPINFVPIQVTNVLGDGLAGVSIQLEKIGNIQENPVSGRSLGAGMYEAQQLLDGVYSLTVKKAGYRETTSNISLHGGEQTAIQAVSLPHYVTVRGTVVNGKGMGVEGAKISLSGLSSQLVTSEKSILTSAHGHFEMDVLVLGTGTADTNGLQEHIEVTWQDAVTDADVQPLAFGVSHDFVLPGTPQEKNLGMLLLPTNFVSTSVQDISGKGLSGVNVSFTDQNGRTSEAVEISTGFYEGQNLPDGVYTVEVSKPGYQTTRKTGVHIGDTSTMPQEASASSSSAVPSPSRHLETLQFQLPYYVTLTGKTVNGKGEALSSNISLELLGRHSELVSNSTMFGEEGNFEVQLMVHGMGREHLKISWNGEHANHTRQVPFMLPLEPGVVDLDRIALPINFIPIEVRDLLGYGVTDASVTLHHLTSNKDIPATELEVGMYEGEHLPDGLYTITVEKEGYKTVESKQIRVADGIVSAIQSFRLQHYVHVTGVAINGEDEGVRDPMIQVEGLRSTETEKQSDITGKFEIELEVRQVGDERIYLTWRDKYRVPILFKLPGTPGNKNLGDIHLPINFLSVLVTDISGSTLQDVQVLVHHESGLIQTFKTDSNGFCKTEDLADGSYTITVKKAGYKTEERQVEVSAGQLLPVRFGLSHYMVVRGTVKDIMGNPLGNVNVTFQEFVGADQTLLRTTTAMDTGQFEQRLLIDDAVFLERQKGHFTIEKEGLKETFLFKIPKDAEQVIHYPTLLLPIKYLHGKVVESDVRAVPVENAEISLQYMEKQPLLADAETSPSVPAQEVIRLRTDSLGQFEVGNLQEGEYKILIQKEGYQPHEEFIRISGLLQEQEFSLRKE